MTSLNLEETVSIQRARELTGVSRRTIYNWMEAGKVQWVRTAGGSVRILLQTLFRDEDGGPLRLTDKTPLDK